MHWSRRWTIEVPGTTPGTIEADPLNSSLLIADGWGVAFASLAVRQIDATSGRVLATVRTRTPIRAFGRATQFAEQAFFFVGQEKIFLHGSTDLQRLSAYDKRVPRYSNEICDVGEGHVVLAAPRAVIEYDLESSRSRRISRAPAVTLGVVDQHPTAVLADGTVITRGAKWEPLGNVGQPLCNGAIDPASAVLAALVGQASSAYDAQGLPQPVAAPRSRSLQIASLRGAWRVRSREVPFPASVVGIVGQSVVAVAAGHGMQTTVADAHLEDVEPSMRVATVPGQFAGFAGPHGFLTWSPTANQRSIELSLFAAA